MGMIGFSIACLLQPIGLEQQQPITTYWLTNLFPFKLFLKKEIHRLWPSHTPLVEIASQTAPGSPFHLLWKNNHPNFSLAQIFL